MTHQFSSLLTLRNIRYAVAAAELGNITAAAERLHISQPAVSMAIAALESHYGRRLFSRNRGQTVTVTAFGRRFLKDARDLLERTRSLGRLGDLEGGVSGEIRLGCFTDISPYYVPKLLTGFATRAAAVTVSFSDAGFDALAQRLESGELDLALTYDLGLSTRIERISLLQLAPYVMLPKGHVLARDKRVSLRRLAEFPVVLADQPLSWQSIVDLFKAAGAEMTSLTRTSSFEMQRSMVANGLGVGIAYTRPVGDRSYDGSPLAIRDIEDAVPEQRIVLAWGREFPLTNAAREFRDFAGVVFARHFNPAAPRTTHGRKL